MKPARLLLAAGLALAGVSVFAAPKSQTYTVVGYYDGAKPSEALVAKATAAVAHKVAGMVQVADSRDADHRIEVLFTRRNTFEVYVDALTLSNGPFAVTYPAPSTNPWDYAMERADSCRSQPVNESGNSAGK